MDKDLTPEISIGLIGHVDHGKTTLTQALSGKWTDTHSEELKRGITIRLGYADASFYYCKKCKKYSPVDKCLTSDCKEKAELKRKVSFIDAPGHETLMATMLSGAAIMDYALLLVAANEDCPQPQTREHLMALNIIGIKGIIIIQNKIDLVDEKTLLENYEQIKKFVKGTIAENSPIIPISAQHNINIDVLIETMEKEFKTPKRDLKKDPLFFIARSFDINKPGSKVKNLVGGVLGGSIKQGTLKVGDKIEIKPGLKTEKENQMIWEPVITEIEGLHSSNSKVKEITPGGSSAILTKLDPAIVKSDNLTGNVVGLQEKIPPVWYDLTLKPKLLERVVGAKDDLVVEPIKKGEVLMLNVNSSATIGVINELKKDIIHAKLKIPVCADKKDRVTISRQLGNRWRLIGWASIEN